MKGTMLRMIKEGTKILFHAIYAKSIINTIVAIEMKTVDEIAQIKANEYASQSYLKDANPISYEGLEVPFFDGFKAGVEFAQRWISVDDELPERSSPDSDSSDEVLTSTNGQYYTLNQYNHKFKAWFFAGMRDKITHWRPIQYK
jgi:hypothetical protein